MMWGQVNVSNGKLTSPSQVDNGFLQFHCVSGCAGCYRVLNALASVDHLTTASAVSCVAAISIPMCCVIAVDLLGPFG